METARLRFAGHLWFLLEVGLVTVCLYDLGVSQHALQIGTARGLGLFWSFAGRAATVVLVGYLCWTVFAWYRGYALVLHFSRLRILVSIQVIAWLLVLLDGSEFHPLRVHFAIGFGVGLYALVMMLRTFVANGLRERTARLIELSVFQVCMIVLGLEVGLRMVAGCSSAPLFAHPQDTAAMVVERNAGRPGEIVLGFARNRNSHYDSDFRKKPIDVRRVVSIGDAFSWGLVPHYDHFTTVVERILGLEVCNLGVPGLGPYEYRYVFRTEGRELDPDVVVVNVFVGDDLVEARQRERARRGPELSLFESWYSRQNVYLCLVTSRILRASWPDEAQIGDTDWLEWERGTSIEQDPGELARAFPWIQNPLRERPMMSDSMFEDVARSRVREYASENLDANLEAFFRAMELLCGDLEGRSWAVVLIPDEAQLDDDLWSRAAQALDGQAMHRTRAQARIAGWLRERSIPCLDLLPALRAVPPFTDGALHVYHRNSGLLNARGNTAAGQAIAAFLAKHFPFL